MNQFGPAPRESSAVIFNFWKMSDTKVVGLWEKTTMHSIDLCHSSYVI